MGSCSTADGAILLKELLGHGLAAHNKSDSVFLGTLKVSSFEVGPKAKGAAGKR